MDNFFNMIKRCNRFIAMIPLILSLAGVISLLSISKSESTFLSREVIIQSVALLAGIFLTVVILLLGYRYFSELDKFLYISGILLLLSVYIPGIGISFYGSRSWIDLGFTTFQPSEIVKIIFIIVMASYLSKHSDSLSHMQGILKAAIYGLPFILIVAKEDFGSGCVFCAIWIFMVFCSGLKLRIIGKAALVFCVLLPVFYFLLAGYQKERIDAFLNPDDLSLPGNYQVWNSKVAIGSGGFFGKGYMDGTQSSLGFLPVPESDFIFAATVEEWGFLGGAAIIILFSILIYNALKTAKYAVDLNGTLIAAGIFGMLFFQSFENIAMNMGLMPVTGITLPFMSYGGSSLLSALAGTGLLLSVSCYQKI